MRLLSRFSAALALAVVLVACDSDPSDDGPQPLLTVNVTNRVGEPAEGLDVFASYGALLSGAFTTETAPRTAVNRAVDLFGPNPNPAWMVARVEFSVSQAGPVRLRALDLQGREQAVLADGEFAAGEHRVNVDVSDWPGGVYRLLIEADGDTAESYLLKTDSASRRPEVGLAIFLGRTDGDGRLVSDDSTRFPALFDVPERFVVTDETGSALGAFEVGRTFDLVLLKDNGATDGRSVTLIEGGTTANVTFAP